MTKHNHVYGVKKNMRKIAELDFSEMEVRACAAVYGRTAPTFLGRQFNPAKYQMLMRTVATQGKKQTGAYILYMLGSCGMSTDLGIEADKTYEVTALQDELTFREVPE